MKVKTTLFGLCAVLAAGAVQAEGIDGLKPGLWEVRVLKMELDGKDILPQMRQQAGDQTVQRMCVSAEMAKNEQAFVPRNPPEAGCAQPRMERSGNRVTFELKCKQSTSKGEVVSEGNKVTSKVEATVEADGAKHTTAAHTQMTFIGSDCGDVKTPEQMARQAQSGAAAPARK